jgi:hypothetical protein
MCGTSRPRITNTVLYLRAHKDTPLAHLLRCLNGSVNGCERLCLGQFSQATRHRNFLVLSHRTHGRKRKRRHPVVVGKKNPSFTIFPDSLDLIATGISAEGDGSQLRIRVLKDLVRLAADMNVKWVQRRSCEVAILSGVCEKIPFRVTNSTYAGRVVCQDLERNRTSMSLVLSRYAATTAVTDRRDARENQQEQQQQQQQQHSYKQQQQKQKQQGISFRSQVFPGVRVKLADIKGTVNVFNNGKYVLVGVRSRQEAEALRAALCAIMRQSWTIFGGGTPCAWTAGGS